VLGKRPRQPQQESPFDRVGELDSLLIGKVVIEATDADQVTVDGLGGEAFGYEVIDIGRHLPSRHLLNGHIHPHHEALKQVQVALHGVSRVVPPLQISPVVHDRVREVHHLPPSLSFP